MSIVSADVEHLALGLRVGIITSIDLAVAHETRIGDFSVNGIILARYARNGLLKHGNVGVSSSTTILILSSTTILRLLLLLSSTTVLRLLSSTAVLRLLSSIGGLQILRRVLISEIGVVGVKTRGENATFVTSRRSIGAQATVMLTSSASVMAPTASSVAENASNACVGSINKCQPS